MKRIFPILLFALLAARPASAQLTLADVQTVVAQAVTRAIALPILDTNAVVAITDREGWVLGVWSLNTNLLGDDDLVAEAIAKAGTAVFLSSDNNAFTSRTAGDIVQQHFPIGIKNKPPGQSAEVFITVVNNPGVDGVAPVVLGTFCTSANATRFSWDVAAQKARTALLYSTSSRAYSTRTVGFLAESFYPPGINGTSPGPFFGMQEEVSIITPTPIVATNPVNGAIFDTATNVDTAVPNGITIFPGGFPLYRDGVLIGAIGVSGDGVDQDDLISASGAALFPAPISIRADQTEYRGTRLPYAKFPRNPGL